MTIRTWNGGTASFQNPEAWTPQGVPSSGDMLIIETGTSVARHVDIDGQNIFFRHSEFALNPVPELVIKGVTISTASRIYTDNIRVPPPVLDFLPGNHGRIEASGHNINYGTIGAFTGNIVSLGSTLDLDLNAGLFVNEGTLFSRILSTLSVTATEDAVLKNRVPQQELWV